MGLVYDIFGVWTHVYPYMRPNKDFRLFYVIFGCSIMISCNSEIFTEKYTLQKILFHFFCFTPISGWERIRTVSMIMSYYMTLNMTLLVQSYGLKIIIGS